MEPRIEPAAGVTPTMHAAPDPLAQVGAFLAGVRRFVEALCALLRTELALARASAVALIGLTLALVFFGIGTWLAVGATIAVGIWQSTGSLIAGIGGVALLNLFGCAVMLSAMRRCWRDLGLPRTRQCLAKARAGGRP